MNGSKTVLGILLSILGFANGGVAQLYPTIYWTDRSSDTINRIDGDLTNHQVLVSGLGEARGVAIDFHSQRMYFADNGRNLIQAADLDGSNIVTLIDTGLGFPADIEVDPQGQKIYWADAQTKKIQRANLDGSQVEDLVTGLGSPYYLELDLDGGHIYWTDYGTDKIQRSNLDGSNVVDLVTTGLSLSRGIALDIPGNQMYWADRGTDQIQRSHLDGSMIETLYTVPPSGVDAAPHGVALDVRNNHLYWLDNGTVKIQRSHLDGTNVTDLITRDDGILSKPWDIQLDLDYKFVCVQPRTCDGITVDNVSSLQSAVRSEQFDPQWDYDVNGALDSRDIELLIHRVVETRFGDANLDGSFDSQDLVAIFTAGEYEDAFELNSTWQTGDWNGDGEFNSSDLVVAMTDGGYINTATASHAVPEPNLPLPLFLCVAILYARRTLLRR